VWAGLDDTIGLDDRVRIGIELEDRGVARVHRAQPSFAIVPSGGVG
jgi:hypothetical protein